MDDDLKQENKESLPTSGGGAWWIPAVAIFSEVSAWIAAPIIGAVILGKYLDNRFDTAPTLLLVSAGLGFIITGYGIVRAVRKFTKKWQK